MEHRIGLVEAVGQLHVAAQHLDQLVVGNDDQRVHELTQLADALLGHLAAAFEVEGTGHHANGQNAHLARRLRHDRGGTGTGAAAHAGSDEQHVGALQMLTDLVQILHGRLAPLLGPRSGAQTTCTQLDAHRHTQIFQRLGIGIGADELHTLNLLLSHVIDGIAATTAQTDHLDYRQSRRPCLLLVQFKTHDTLLFIEPVQPLMERPARHHSIAKPFLQILSATRITALRERGFSATSSAEGKTALPTGFRRGALTSRPKGSLSPRLSARMKRLTSRSSSE